jgi:hypothetical protein
LQFRAHIRVTSVMRVSYQAMDLLLPTGQPDLIMNMSDIREQSTTEGVIQKCKEGWRQRSMAPSI